MEVKNKLSKPARLRQSSGALYHSETEEKGKGAWNAIPDSTTQQEPAIAAAHEKAATAVLGISMIDWEEVAPLDTVAASSAGRLSSARPRATRPAVGSDSGTVTDP